MMSLTSWLSDAYRDDSKFAFCAWQAQQSNVDLHLASLLAIAYNNHWSKHSIWISDAQNGSTFSLLEQYIPFHLWIEQFPPHKYPIHRIVDWFHRSTIDIYSRIWFNYGDPIDNSILPVSHFNLLKHCWACICFPISCQWFSSKIYVNQQLKLIRKTSNGKQTIKVLISNCACQ